VSKCVYCHERKGKRPCPALGGSICSQCCGEHRMTRITCPADCVYLDTNSAYQQKRAGERFALERRTFYTTLFELGGEPAAALFNLIEITAFGYFHDRRDGQDGEVIAAVQSLRRTLSPLHIPAGPPPVFAERLRTEYEAFAKQQSQQPSQPALDPHLAIEVIDKALAFITQISGSGLQSTRFLTALIGYIHNYHPQIADHLTKQVQESGRILLPGQLPTGSIAPPHEPAPTPSHAHHHTHHH
jgi:hypothetical protein